MAKGDPTPDAVQARLTPAQRERFDELLRFLDRSKYRPESAQITHAVWNESMLLRECLDAGITLVWIRAAFRDYGRGGFERLLAILFQEARLRASRWDFGRREFPEVDGFTRELLDRLVNIGDDQR